MSFQNSWNTQVVGTFICSATTFSVCSICYLSSIVFYIVLEMWKYNQRTNENLAYMVNKWENRESSENWAKSKFLNDIDSCTIGALIRFNCKKNIQKDTVLLMSHCLLYHINTLHDSSKWETILWYIKVGKQNKWLACVL